jgi:hypothetical protein
MPKPFTKRLDAYVQLLPEHRKRPEVSLQQHVALRMTALANRVLQRQRIYLDTRFWILLRDAAIGRPRQPVHVELLTRLRERVQSGAIICPVSDGTLLEVLRQSDPETRLATARLMDELSLGAAILNAEERLVTEVAHFISTATKPGAVMNPPSGSVWLKAAYTLGMLHPAGEGVDAAEQLALAKAFVDLMWSLSLEELLTDTPMLPEAIHEAFRETAVELTTACRAHASEIRDWNSLYVDEVQGFVEAHSDAIQRACLQVYDAQHPGRPRPSNDEMLRSTRRLVNSCANLIRLGKAGNALPRVQIEAGIHAIIRWHRARPFSAQDFVDISHATAALPYCHLFLTERFLGTALGRPPLNLAQQFGVGLAWEAGAALTAIERLPGPSQP